MCLRRRGTLRRRGRSGRGRTGSARCSRSAPSSPRGSPRRRTARSPPAPAGAALRGSSASRWRWSRSCSAVSTTEVTIPGRQTTPPRGADGAVPDLRRDLAQLERELRCAGKRVAALVHRRRAGMRRLARPRDPPALDAVGAEHGPEGDVHRLEHRPLLDVELEIGRGRVELRRAPRARGRDRLRCGERVGERDPVAVAQLPELVLVAASSRLLPRSRRASGRSARPPRRPS